MALNLSLKVKEVFFIVLIILCNIKSFALCRCFIELSDDVNLRPQIWLTIGSHQIDLTSNTDQDTITYFTNQKLKLQCNTKFQYPESYQDRHEIELICQDNYRSYSEGKFECSRQQWNLYESFQDFVWCPKNTSSYIIARSTDIAAKNFQYLAGVCLDMQYFSFKSLYHTISAKSFQSPAVLNNLYKPSLEVEHFKENFGSRNILERHYRQPVVQNWLQFARYNYSSIIQNSLLLDEYRDQFGSLLNLTWWPSLRLGNWQRYETALKDEVENKDEALDIIAGVSAAAAVPIIKKCATNFTWADIDDNSNGKIPLYIWNYVLSRTNSSEEIVIIGVNSPFYEFYSESDIVFCKDICQDISWLKKASTTFRYSALGIIFCCSAEDVKMSKRLDGFPDVDISTKPEVANTVAIDPALDETIGILFRH